MEEEEKVFDNLAAYTYEEGTTKAKIAAVLDKNLEIIDEKRKNLTHQLKELT